MGIDKHVSRYGKGDSLENSEAKEVMPLNCKTPCPYGRTKPFCFPCMKKILDESKNTQLGG